MSRSYDPCQRSFFSWQGLQALTSEKKTPTLPKKTPTMHPKPPQILKIEQILGFQLTETQDSEDIFNWNKSKCYTLNEAQEVTGLSVNRCGLATLDFLQPQLLPQLTRFNLNANKLTDISALQYVPQLISLDFGDNKVVDISVLKELRSLQNLRFRRNRVKDLFVLQHLSKLQELNFGANPVRNIKILKYLPNLTFLDCSQCKLSNEDISILQHLPKLTSLWFSNNQVSDISVLQQLPNLTRLDFGFNQVADISVLQHLTNLTDLSFNKNQVVDISVLQHLTNLTSLYFWINQVANISVLQHLTNLEELYFSENQVADISVLQHLTNLTVLGFGSNQVSGISVLQHLANLRSLNFSYNQVSDISVLQHLSDLTELNFDGNLISDISVLQQLINLTSLNITSNQVSDISVLQHLPNLTQLSFGFNQISDISVLQYLQNLTSVDAKHNKLAQFSDFLLATNLTIQWKDFFFNDEDLGINLYGNPITNVPIEIIQEGKEAIRRYLDEKKGKPLYEAKLIIVGEGEAGKTSLAEKLMDRSYVLAPQATTHGLAIKKWRFPYKGQTYTANIWDFGGQEIYKNTHRFFLTRNSLYILLTDNRKEDTDFNYWLEKIKLLGGNSPVLIVQNEKDKRKKDLPDFPFSNIRGVFQIDLADNSGLDKLEEAVKTHFSALENMQRPFPVDWLAVREALECKTQPYISLDKYQEICEQNNIPEKIRQQDLGQYLHDLGVLLHYKEDDFLQHKIFLQPTWVTKAVYELIDFMGKGQFTAQDAKNLWEQPKYEGTYEQMHLFLLKIIAKFELCYEQNAMYVMPQLLSAKVPTYMWDTANNLQIQFEYAFPLQGIFWRLIVRLHRLIGVDNVVWKEGVIFEKKYHEQTTKALVTETYKNKVPTIMVKVAGLQRKDLLAVIMHEIETINGFYNFSEAQAPILKVPCNCELCNQSSQPQLYEYKKLLRRLENKVYEVQCEESFNQVTIRPLLDDVFDDSFLRNEAMRTGKEMSFDRFGMLGKFDSFEEIENHNFMTKQELLDLIDENELGRVFSEMNNYHFGSNQSTYSQLRDRNIDGEKDKSFKQQLVVFINSFFDTATRKPNTKTEPSPQNEKPTVKENAMPKVERNDIFISYSWKPSSNTVVDEVQQTLKEKGIIIKRDKDVLGYKGDIEKFMQLIGQGKAVILVIGKDYLEAENCMKELMYIWEHGDVHERFIPIYLDNADIHKAHLRANYTKYWTEAYKSILESAKDTDLNIPQEDVLLYRKISQEIGKLMIFLQKYNALTVELHREDNWQALIGEINKIQKKS